MGRSEGFFLFFEQQRGDTEVVVAQHRLSHLLWRTDEGGRVSGRACEVGHFHPESLVVHVLVGGHLN